MRTTPLPIDENIFAWDREIKELGRQGFTHKTIRRMINETYNKKFTQSQISTRLRVTGVSTLAYRNGEGAYAQQACQRARARVLRIRGLLRDAAAFEKRIKKGRD